MASTDWQMDFMGSEVLAYSVFLAVTSINKKRVYGFFSQEPVGLYSAMARNPSKVCAEGQDPVGAGACGVSLKGLCVEVGVRRHQGTKR